ncbi:MAG: hypothetical protein CM15mP116_00280 [Synechococcus sp.]|nr:MAG: hypothetical protein CM15mP116_00280 [Synechococcus sp.]
MASAVAGWKNLSVPAPLVGILTDGDLRRALQEHSTDRWPHLTAADLMTSDPITVDGDLLVVKALERMETQQTATADLGPTRC